MELRALGRYSLVRRLEGSPSRSELFVAALPEEGEAERYVAKLLMPGSEDTRARAKKLAGQIGSSHQNVAIETTGNRGYWR